MARPAPTLHPSPGASKHCGTQDSHLPPRAPLRSFKPTATSFRTPPRSAGNRTPQACSIPDRFPKQETGCGEL